VGREWKFDAAGGSLGTVTFNIDPTKFPALPSQYTTYYLMVDADGDFTSRATLYRIDASNQVTGVTIADGAVATVACVRPVVLFTQAVSNALENAGSATIQVSLNYASSAAITVPFSVNGACTATGAGVNTPAYRANLINGKPAIEFKASESDYYNLPTNTSLWRGEITQILQWQNLPEADAECMAFWSRLALNGSF
jgi:hypothetical protein